MKLLILIYKFQDVYFDLEVRYVKCGSISYHFIPHLANMEADALAKSALYSLSLDVLATV